MVDDRLKNSTENYETKNNKLDLKDLVEKDDFKQKKIRYVKIAEEKVHTDQDDKIKKIYKGEDLKNNKIPVDKLNDKDVLIINGIYISYDDNGEKHIFNDWSSLYLVKKQNKKTILYLFNTRCKF